MCIVSVLSAVLTISKSDMFTMLCLVLCAVLVALLGVLVWVLYQVTRTPDYEDMPMPQTYSPYYAQGRVRNLAAKAARAPRGEYEAKEPPSTRSYPQMERTWTIEEAREKLPLIMTPQMQREMGMNMTSRLDAAAAQQRTGVFRVIRTIEMTHADEVV